MTLSHSMYQVTTIVLLCETLFLGAANGTYVYKNGDLTYDVSNCERLKGKPAGTPQQIECMENEGILEHWPRYIEGSITKNTGRTDEVLCRGQRGICESKYPYYKDSLTAGCLKMVDGCRSALRHLVDMMLRTDPAQQECNNFALKSVRGFFHDYMSNDIEGSLLSENNLSMNVGLCRWTQYVNVLSDHTGCDAGSIIQMAGFLGYEACGFELWSVDIDVKPYVFLNGGMSCVARTKGDEAAPKKKSRPLFDSITGERLEEFEDITVSASSTATENFWCAVNPHGCATSDGEQSDGEAEYSGEATAAAHVIGRVTCPVTGKTLTGSTPQISAGFFHLPRTEKTNGIGIAALKERVNEGYSHLIETQCATQSEFPKTPSSDGKVPTGAVRPNTTKWPTLDGETNLNTIGGLCGMPTQFLKTVKVGGRHRVPRFMSISAGSRYGEHTDFQKEQCSDRSRKIYIPLELLTIRKEVSLPTSPALDRFLGIAWNGIGTIDSAWDSCDIGCDINVSDNRMCGGRGLSNFMWSIDSGGKQNPNNAANPNDAVTSLILYLYILGILIVTCVI